MALSLSLYRRISKVEVVEFFFRLWACFELLWALNYYSKLQWGRQNKKNFNANYLTCLSFFS